MTYLAFALVFAVGVAIGFALCLVVERIPLFDAEWNPSIADTETEIPDEPVSDQFPVLKPYAGMGEGQ